MIQENDSDEDPSQISPTPPTSDASRRVAYLHLRFFCGHLVRMRQSDDVDRWMRQARFLMCSQCLNGDASPGLPTLVADDETAEEWHAKFVLRQLQ